MCQKVINHLSNKMQMRQRQGKHVFFRYETVVTGISFVEPGVGNGDQMLPSALSICLSFSLPLYSRF